VTQDRRDLTKEEQDAMHGALMASTTPASDPQLDEWEKLANAATSGPWQAMPYSDSTYSSPDRWIKADGANIADEVPEADAAFIAAAREAIPELIAMVREKDTRADAWKDQALEWEVRATAAEAEVERLKAKLREEENTRLKQVGELAGELVRLHAALGWAET
jgi:hypothetical protein